MATQLINISKKSSPLLKMIKAEPEKFSVLKEGDLVEATLLDKEGGEAYFSLGRFGTGIVFGREHLNARDIIKKTQINESVTAKIVEVNSDTGYIELSLTEADKQKVWQELRELKEKDEVLKVTIESANSGGLLTEINEVKAFLPVSQLSNQNYPRVSDNNKEAIFEELNKFVGQEMEVKILTVNPKSNKLIISEREITNENVQEVLGKYKVGDVVEGIISGVADFGAFMRFASHPEVEGLIHISELDHRLVENPKEIIQVDDEVKAMIAEIKDGRVSLSIKALKPDPWKKLPEMFSEKQEVKGVPFKYNPFGAFVNVEGADVQGLIHVSEFGSVETMKEKLKLNKEYAFIIDTLKPEEKRLILKLKKKEEANNELSQTEETEKTDSSASK